MKTRCPRLVRFSTGQVCVQHLASQAFQNARWAAFLGVFFWLGHASAQANTSGSFFFTAQHWAYEMPLFGDRTNSNYQFFVNQGLGASGQAMGWFRDGSGTTRPEFNVSLQQLAWNSNILDVQAGDLTAEPAAFSGFAGLPLHSYAMRGGSVRWTHANTEMGAYGGEARSIATAGIGNAKPTLLGAYWQRSDGRLSAGLGGTGVWGLSLAGGRQTNTGILNASLGWSPRSRSNVGARINASSDGAIAGGVAVTHNFGAGDIFGEVFFTERDFPSFSPEQIPGQVRALFQSNYRLNDFMTVHGGFLYSADQRAGEAKDATRLHGQTSLWWNLGSDRPQVVVTLSRDQANQLISGSDLGNLDVNRLAVSLTKGTLRQRYLVSLEHSMLSDGQPDRGQAWVNYTRFLGPSSVFNLSWVVQREGSKDFGSTLDSTLELPLGRRWRMLGGLGGSYVNRPETKAGDGLLRLGLTRQFDGSGLTVQAVADVPVSLGLASTGLIQKQVALNVTQRTTWSNPRDLKRRLDFLETVLKPGRHGDLQGRVVHEGRGLEGVTILVAGKPGAVTGRDGNFRIERLPVGPVEIGLDVFSLPDRFQVVGPDHLIADIVSGVSVKTEFQVAIRSYLQGSAVYCHQGVLEPLLGVGLKLSNESGVRTFKTDSSGSFQIEGIVPGVYTLEFEPDSLPVEAGTPSGFSLDLRHDLSGFLIQLGCS